MLVAQWWRGQVAELSCLVVHHDDDDDDDGDGDGDGEDDDGEDDDDDDDDDDDYHHHPDADADAGGCWSRQYPDIHNDTMSETATHDKFRRARTRGVYRCIEFDSHCARRICWVLRRGQGWSLGRPKHVAETIHELTPPVKSKKKYIALVVSDFLEMLMFHIFLVWNHWINEISIDVIAYSSTLNWMAALILVPFKEKKTAKYIYFFSSIFPIFLQRNKKNTFNLGIFSKKRWASMGQQKWCDFFKETIPNGFKPWKRGSPSLHPMHEATGGHGFLVEEGKGRGNGSPAINENIYICCVIYIYMYIYEYIYIWL